jgi:hypothetical protein
MSRPPHVRPLRGALTAAILTTMLTGQLAMAAPPGSSGVVTRFTEAFAVSYIDEADGLIAVGGPPPEEGCFGEGFDDPAEFMNVQTPAGPILAKVHQAVSDVFVYDLTLGHPCEILDAGGTPLPLYTGTWRTVGNDNDLHVTLTRTNSFGFRSAGWVEDAEGDRCRISAHVRLLITRQGEFRVVNEGITLAC